MMEVPYLTALPRPRSSGGSLRSLTASMTAARRWGPDPDGAFFLRSVSWGGDEAEGAACGRRHGHWRPGGDRWTARRRTDGPGLWLRRHHAPPRVGGLEGLT